MNEKSVHFVVSNYIKLFGLFHCRSAVWYMFTNVSGEYTDCIFRMEGLGTGKYGR